MTLTRLALILSLLCLPAALEAKAPRKRGSKPPAAQKHASRKAGKPGAGRGKAARGRRPGKAAEPKRQPPTAKEIAAPFEQPAAK